MTSLRMFGGVFCQSSSVIFRSSGRGPTSTIEPLPEVFHQGIEVDRLRLPVPQMTIAMFGHPGCFPHMNPVGRPVTGAAKASHIDKGLHKDQILPVEGLPICGKPAGGGSQHLRGQVLYPNPGQDQKAHLIGNKPKVLLPPLSVPAYEGVPTPNPPCRRTPAKTRCHLPVEVDQILQVR